VTSRVGAYLHVGAVSGEISHVPASPVDDTHGSPDVVGKPPHAMHPFFLPLSGASHVWGAPEISGQSVAASHAHKFPAVQAARPVFGFTGRHMPRGLAALPGQ